MEGWFLTYDQGEGRPSAFAFVDDLSPEEIDTLHSLLQDEINAVGAAFEIYSTDYLLGHDRAMLIRLRREWREIERNLNDPMESDGDRLHQPWFSFYFLFLDFRDEIVSLREFDQEADNDETEDEPPDYESRHANEAILMKLLESLQTIIPVWNDETKILSWGTRVARQVSHNAKNVLAVLNAFQEDSWPARIDDPLPGGRNPERLRTTLKQLNKDLKFIRFNADGSGEGVAWAKIEAGETSPPD